MGLMDIVLGPRCDMCGQRKSDVGPRAGTQLRLCTKDSKALKASDRSKPAGSSAAGYRPGQPPKLARGVMGGRYVGPEPPPQRRK